MHILPFSIYPRVSVAMNLWRKLHYEIYCAECQGFICQNSHTRKF